MGNLTSSSMHVYKVHTYWVWYEYRDTGRKLIVSETRPTTQCWEITTALTLDDLQPGSERNRNPKTQIFKSNLQVYGWARSVGRLVNKAS